MSSLIRAQVASRANYRCEYCHLPETVSFYSFHIDHIRSIKHGGDESEIENLAYCCPDCNFYKGSDIGSFANDNSIIRFYNPRKDIWKHHFEFTEGSITPKTDIGIVTERIFKFNEVERLIFRKQLFELKLI